MLAHIFVNRLPGRYLQHRHQSRDHRRRNRDRRPQPSAPAAGPGQPTHRHRPAVRADRLAADRAGQTHRIPGLLLAGSLKFGHASASLLVGKLSASDRQNTLAAALKAHGALRRKIYAARYLWDSAYRRKISRQLNKGESLHAL
ncbi:Transposase [Rhodococcus wratislaviensis]|uniref:Transposase n=1 Tax=Rhodococcus wratislaviensis TaxID=44752 RepID=A0A402CB86_RHOWR|nr:Transposase [Rhodococcus wratislaviensis]